MFVVPFNKLAIPTHHHHYLVTSPQSLRYYVTDNSTLSNCDQFTSLCSYHKCLNLILLCVGDDWLQSRRCESW